MEQEKEQATLLQMLTDPSQREQGFRQLTRLYGEKLYWHIRRIVVGHDDTEDVLQETFIKVLGSADSFRGEAKLSTWLYSIATREALMLLRRKTHLFQSIDDLAPSLSAKMVAETPMNSDSIEVIFQQALLTLPTQQRIAFNLRYYDGLHKTENALASHVAMWHLACLPDAEAAQLCHQTISELPDRLDTELGERGGGLSEGQAQRIAIARGLLCGGTILLLDEISSALDEETEHELYRRLFAACPSQSILLITHRKAATRLCDEVISYSSCAPSPR